MADDHFFHRHALARELSDRILSTAALAPARSGLFLAAPRGRVSRRSCARTSSLPSRLLARPFSISTCGPTRPSIRVRPLFRWSGPR
jgi:hypothetical protein